MIYIGVCDDLIEERLRLKQTLLKRLTKYNQIFEILEYESGKELIKAVETKGNLLDMLFLDIYMPDMLGTDVAKKIREFNKQLPIIFLTTSPDFAIESYDVRAFGYLVKPIKIERLDFLLDTFFEEKYPKFQKSMMINSGGKGIRIPYSDILYIESIGHNLKITCLEDREYKLRGKIGDLIMEVENSNFLRCNQSFMINMDYVIAVGDEFTMKNNVEIPIKVRERKAIRNAYYEYILNQPLVNGIIS